MIEIMDAVAVALGAVTIGMVAGLRRPEDTFWKKIGVKSPSEKYPHLLSKTKTESGVTYLFHVPDGISMEPLADPKNARHQMIRQSLGDNRRIEVVPVNGHKMAIKVFERALKDTYDYSPVPVDPNDPLVFALGESLSGRVIIKLGNTIPHLCIPGSAGSGKSVCMRGMVCSLCLHPKETSIHLIDLKGGVEFLVFMKCQRVKSYAKTPDEGVAILRKLQQEMIRRNELFFSEGVNSIDSYNAKHPDQPMERHVLFIDEFAEYSKNNDAKAILKDLSRRARSCGIHMVIATQRPDADVLDGQIRANITGYVCFMVASTTNSTLIIGHGGAEQLPGHGRAILRAPAQKEVEFQGYYLSEDECEELVRPTYVEKAPPQDDTKGVFRK